MPKRKHTHKYYRMPFSDHYVWKCALVECNHHIPRHMEEDIKTKLTICWVCGTKFPMTEGIALTMNKPTCLDCSPDSIAVRIAKDESILENLGNKK